MCKRESFINYRSLRMALWKTFFFFNLKNIFTFRESIIFKDFYEFPIAIVTFLKKNWWLKHTHTQTHILLHLWSPEVRNQFCWAKNQVWGWPSSLQRSEVLPFPALREALRFLTHGTFIFSQQSNILKFLSILGLALPSVF